LHNQVEEEVVQRRISIKQRDHFSHQLMLLGGVGPRRDFNRSTKDNFVQEVDKETGLRIWEAEVVDTNPEAHKSERSFTVKIVSEQQPVPPAAPEGQVMTPVVFRHLEAMPWVDADRCNGKEQPHRCRARLMWSYRASGFEDTTSSGTGSSASSSSASAGEPASSSKSSGSSSGRSAA
jgi:hypothetical protein